MAELSVTATSLQDCAVCGKTFAPTRADAQYCSGACRQTAYRKRVTDNRARVTEILRRCDHCGRPGAKAQDFNGRTVYLHDDCHHEWADALAETSSPGKAAQTIPETEPPALTNGGAVEKPPDAVATVPDQAEKVQGADQRVSATPVSVTAPSSEADCVVCGGDLYQCFPLKCPLRRLH
jgi:predicted nucleic acid-binding Zn ribbon protein